MTGLKAEAFIQRHGFERHSYLRLERGESYLKDHVADAILKALEYEGVKASKQWILDGTGEPPTSSKRVITTKKDEIDFFKSRDGSTILQVDHDDLAPWISRGDTVGGIKTNLHMISNKKIYITIDKNKKKFLSYIVRHNACIVLILFSMENGAAILDIINDEDLEKTLFFELVMIFKQKKYQEKNVVYLCGG